MTLAKSFIKKYPFFAKIIDLAEQLLHPQKIIIFGSRARGDHQSTSDFDLAFDFPPTSDAEWGHFCTTMEEDIPTLASFDLVNMREASSELMAAIRKEGIILYERKDKK